MPEVLDEQPVELLRCRIVGRFVGPTCRAVGGLQMALWLTFPKGQLPPVKYFWSITMYSIPQLARGEPAQAAFDR